MDSAASTTSTAISSEHYTKRVILRLRVNEFEEESCGWEDHIDAIKAYLVWARCPASKYDDAHETSEYFAHVEPFQALELKQTMFHIILNIEHQSLN